MADQLILEPSGDCWLANAIQKDDLMWIDLVFEPSDIPEIEGTEWQIEVLQDSEEIKQIRQGLLGPCRLRSAELKTMCN